MMIPFQPLDVLSNTPHSTVLPVPMRVLEFVAGKDELWLIALPGRVGKKNTRRDTYTGGPVRYSLSDFVAHVSESRVAASKFISNPVHNMPDGEMLARAATPKARIRVEKQIRHRDHRWELVAPIVAGRSFLEVINDSGRTTAIAQRAKEAGVSRTTIYYLLHRYWASGSRKNGLINSYARCGSPGVSKAQGVKLGRRTRLHKAGEPNSEGYVLDDDEDKRKLAWGYALIRHNTTPHDAWLATSGVHWAERTIDEGGKESVELLPPLQRPSYDQFLYWGKLLNGEKSITEMVLGKLEFDKRAGARGGSLQDQVTAVGQLGVFDSTSTDTYLTSRMSRLRVLPPMTRLVAQDVRSEVIYGLHCGWEAPSPATALQAILHGATPKPLWCKRFGIEITEEDWPHQLTRNIQADNGELKASVPTEAERQFGFSITYTPTNRGDKKGGLESSHRAVHKELDHKVPGSTKGKARTRGVPHAAGSALWNYYEYMRELIVAILKFNNQERLELAPLEMLREIPAIKPTRLNIFHWLRKQGMRADLPVDVDALRGFTLPDVKAVVRKNGVYLLGTILGHEQVLPKMRYTSPELVATGLMSRVKASGSPLRTVVKMDLCAPEQAWLPTQVGMIPLRLAGNDTLLSRQITLADWQDHLAERTLARDKGRGVTHQADLETFLRRQATTATAKAERQAELSELSKPPSESAIKRNLRKHRDEEMASLDAEARNQPVQGDGATPLGSSDMPPPEKSTHRPSAADLAMRQLNDEEFGNANE